ncbi:MAG: ferredoxin [Ginsengibacter sp.]
MMDRKRDINFTILHNNEEIKVATYEGEFRNLMVLINEKIYVEDFGECKGIGRCGTCLIIAEGLDNSESVMERNEKSTLQKCAAIYENLRLSCQIMINESLQDAVLKIVEEREDVR